MMWSVFKLEGVVSNRVQSSRLSIKFQTKFQMQQFSGIYIIPETRASKKSSSSARAFPALPFHSADASHWLGVEPSSTQVRPRHVDGRNQLTTSSMVCPLSVGDPS